MADVKLEELRVWWMEALIAHGIPMLRNEFQDGSLTEACLQAKNLGARLITRVEMREWLEGNGGMK